MWRASMQISVSRCEHATMSIELLMQRVWEWIKNWIIEQMNKLMSTFLKWLNYIIIIIINLLIKFLLQTGEACAHLRRRGRRRRRPVERGRALREQPVPADGRRPVQQQPSPSCAQGTVVDEDYGSRWLL